MLKTLLVTLTVLLTILGAYILGNYYRQIGFEYPMWYSEFLMDTFKPSNAEEAYDLYIISNVILSFFVACFISGVICLLWRWKSTLSSGS